MKKLALMMFLICGVSFAENTYTTNAGIPKPADSDTGWGETIRDAFDIIDSSFATLSGTQTFTGGVTITSGTVTTLRSNSVYISSPSYSGSSDLYVNGTGAFVDSLSIGESGALGAPYLSFTNNYVGGFPTSINHSGSYQSALVEKSSIGTFINTLSNSPNALWASQILAGPSYFTYGTSFYGPGPNGDESSIENELFIGTTTIASSPKLGVIGNTSSAYSILVGTTPALTASNYHFFVSTDGVVAVSTTFQIPSKTLAQLAATIPSSVGQVSYCSNCTTDAVCVSTQTVTASWARTSAKTTACQ